MQEQTIKQRPHKIKGCLTLKDCYKFWKKKVADKHTVFVSEKEYKEICYRFNKAIIKYLIFEAGEISLPYHLGNLKIRKRKTNLKNLRIDFGEYRRTGLKVKHLNEHSDGYYSRFYWQKGVVQNISAYAFIPAKGNRKQLSNAIKSRQVDFFE